MCYPSREKEDVLIHSTPQVSLGQFAAFFVVDAPARLEAFEIARD